MRNEIIIVSRHQTIATLDTMFIIQAFLFKDIQGHLMSKIEKAKFNSKCRVATCTLNREVTDLQLFMRVDSST